MGNLRSALDDEATIDLTRLTGSELGDRVRELEEARRRLDALWIETLVAFDLPDDYYSTYTRVIDATSADDVRRVAAQYLDPEHLVIAISGDRKTIEPRLRALGLGSPAMVDVDALFATPR